MDDFVEVAVDSLARKLAKARTHGNVYMDCTHNPIPSELRQARDFVEWIVEETRVHYS